MRIASIGLRTKTAKAIAVALADRDSPQFIHRWNLDLYDPAVPATGQPHHEVMELPWPEAQVAVWRLETIIQDVTTDRLQEMLKEMRASSLDVRAIGVVGSPDRNLEKIGNRHIRAHAAEGTLFRRAVEVAAKRCKVACRPFSDRGFDEVAATELRRTSQEIKRVLTVIGHSAGRPWRTDERAAAAAAWIAAGRANRAV